MRHQPDSMEPEAAEALAPAYVSVGEAALSSEAPVLALEGLAPWDPVRGPALGLEEMEAPLERRADSRDPLQLELAGPEPAEAKARAYAVAESVAIPVVTDRPAEEARVGPEPHAAEPVFDEVELVYAEAKAASEARRPDEARRLYREVLARRPNHVRARNNLALIMEAEGNHDGALAELDRALEIEPDHATLLVNRGSLLGQMGRYSAAERDLKRVLRIEPSNVEALFSLGVVMTKKGLWGEAVPQLRRVVELEPQRGPAHYYLGEALNHVDDLAGAMGAYQRAAELMPDYPRALYGLGIIYDRIGRPDDAARMYRKSRDVARG